MRHRDKGGCGPRWGWARSDAGDAASQGWGRFRSGGPMGRGGTRGPRVFGQGDLRILLLALIADKPSHGYDLIRSIEARFNGAYTPSAGTIYPTLTLLEEQELIEAEPEGGGKKSYRATAKGRAFLEESSDMVQALMTRIGIMAEGGPDGPPSPAIIQAIHTLRSAVMARSAPDPEEQDRIRTIIEQAARDIIKGK